MKYIFVLIHLFFLNNIYSQWEYVFNKSEKKIEAVGKVFYNETYKDSMILKMVLMKQRVSL